METEQTKTTVFSKIKSEADAIKIIKDAALAFFVIAGVQMIMGAVGERLLFVTAIALALLTLWLRSQRSRLASFMILISSIGVSALILVDQARLSNLRLAVVVLAAIVLFLAVRCVQATGLLSESGEVED